MSFAAIFIFGSLLGSFFNVCIRRLPAGKSVLVPASYCFKCRRAISPAHNIPVLSYLFLRGKCAFCGAPFSIQYPLVEFLTPVFYLGLYLRYGFGSEFFLYVVLSSFLIVIAFIDINRMLILDRLSYPLAALGLLVSGWRAAMHLRSGGELMQAVSYPLGFFAGAGVLLTLYVGWRWLRHEEGLGLGDVKLAAAIGPWLGVRMVLEALFLSFLLGSLWGVVLIAMRRKQLKDQLPFGAFIALAAYLRLLLGVECKLIF